MDEPAIFAETAELFALVPDRRARLEHLAELGERLEFPKEDRITENLVPGCVSIAYVTADLKDGKMVYRGWADALIVRGFMVLLTEGLSGLTPREVVDEAPAIVERFLDRTGLNASLVESRANTFANVFAKMRALAEARL